MFARIAMNVAAVFIPLYVATVTAKVNDEGEESAETNFQVATVPLTAYTSSLLWSLFGQGWVNEKFSSRLSPMLIALVLTAISSLPFIWFSETPE